MIGSYSAYQTELSDRIIRLRDSERLTYRAIADLLIKNGIGHPEDSILVERVFSQSTTESEKKEMTELTVRHALAMS